MLFPFLYASDGDLIVYGLITFFGIALYVFIIRAVFRIDTQVNNQRAMIWLLIKNWEKQGGTAEEVNKFVKTFNIK